MAEVELATGSIFNLEVCRTQNKNTLHRFSFFLISLLSTTTMQPSTLFAFILATLVVPSYATFWYSPFLSPNHKKVQSFHCKQGFMLITFGIDRRLLFSRALETQLPEDMSTSSRITCSGL